MSTSELDYLTAALTELDAEQLAAVGSWHQDEYGTAIWPGDEPGEYERALDELAQTEFTPPEGLAPQGIRTAYAAAAQLLADWASEGFERLTSFDAAAGALTVYLEAAAELADDDKESE